MSRVSVKVVSLAAAVALLLGVASWASAGNGGKGGARTVTVVEHATTDVTTDTGAPGDSVGDIVTFANEVFDRKDATKVGSDQGYCLRVVKGGSYECNWTTILPGGQITVEGPFYDDRDSTLAITGGTGRYRKARGVMELHSIANGTKFQFTFRLTG